MPGSHDFAPIRRVTVRFTDRSHRLIEESAEREGIPLAQYIREAALARVAWELGTSSAERRGTANARDIAQALRDGFDQIRRRWRDEG